MKKAFTIIRVSGRDQLKGNGPDAQWEDDILLNAPVLELEVNEEYRRSIQESASGWNRPKFEVAVNEAIELHKRGEIQAVLFPRVDRETRFLFSSVPLLNKIIGAGLEIYFAEEQLFLDSNDPESVQRYTDKVKAAQDYIATLRRNTMKGRRKRVKKGRLPTGVRMFGFTYIKGKEEGQGIRIINEDEADWIRHWRDWILEDGLTINKVSLRMRPQRPMTPSTISCILANPAIMGKTYAYTCSYENYIAPDGTHKKRLVKKPREEWIEMKLLEQSLMGFPEELVIQENQKMNGDRAVFLQRKTDLEAKIEQTQGAAVDKENIKLACEMVSQNLGNLTYEDKRLAIEALDIQVWIRHDELIMEGSIPMPDVLSNLSVTSRCLR